MTIERGFNLKKIIETNEVGGLESLLGEEVILLCANYFYAGKLVAVNKDFVQLDGTRLVYETGAWGSKSYTDAQNLPGESWYVQTSFIESYGHGK